MSKHENTWALNCFPGPLGKWHGAMDIWILRVWPALGGFLAASVCSLLANIVVSRWLGENHSCCLWLFFFLSRIRFGECAKFTCNFCRKTRVWVSKGNQIFWGNPFCTTPCPDNKAIVKWMASSLWKEYSYSSCWVDTLDQDVYLKPMWYFERCSKLSKTISIF